MVATEAGVHEVPRSRLVDKMWRQEDDRFFVGVTEANKPELTRSRSNDGEV